MNGYLVQYTVRYTVAIVVYCLSTSLMSDEVYYNAYKTSINSCSFLVKETPSFCTIRMHCRRQKDIRMTFRWAEKVKVSKIQSVGKEDRLTIWLPEYIYPLMCRGIKKQVDLTHQNQVCVDISVINVPRMMDWWRRSGNKFNLSSSNLKIDSVKLGPVSLLSNEAGEVEGDSYPLTLLKGLDVALLFHQDNSTVLDKPRMYHIEPYYVRNATNYDRSPEVLCGKLLGKFNIYDQKSKRYFLRWFHPDKKMGVPMPVPEINSCLDVGIEGYRVSRIKKWQAYYWPVSWRMKRNRPLKRQFKSEGAKYYVTRIRRYRDVLPVSAVAILMYLAETL